MGRAELAAPGRCSPGPREGDRQVSAQPVMKWTGLWSPEHPDLGSEHFKNSVASYPRGWMLRLGRRGRREERRK